MLMRILPRSGPLFLALGVALTGCSQPANTPAKASNSSAEKAPEVSDGQVVPGLSQVVLTVEGMS
jgi:hypothetical protein